MPASPVKLYQIMLFNELKIERCDDAPIIKIDGMKIM